MPADASAAEAVLLRQRRIGLRVALAVAAGFTWNLATGAVIPFFGPVLAVQFLILGAGPLPLSKAVAFVGLVLVVGQAFIVINGIFGDNPIQLLALLGLFYFVCFFVQARGQGGPVIFLCLALANAAILLGVMALCLTNNALSLALVLPITFASVLLQFHFATSVPSALSF